MRISQVSLVNKPISFKNSTNSTNNTRNNKTTPTYDNAVRPLAVDTVNFEKNTLPPKSLKKGFGKFVKNVQSFFSPAEVSGDYLNDEELSDLIFSRCNLL